MNFRIIAKVLGILIILIGVAMSACAIFSEIEVRHSVEESGPAAKSAVTALWVGTGISVFFGLALFLFGFRCKNDILRREAIVIVGLSWILAAGFGAIPFYLCDPGLGMVESYFESMSGITTTGSTVMEDIEAYPRGVLLWRSTLQWLGGIGIVVLFAAVLSFLGVGSRSLMQQESSLNISDSNASRVSDIALMLLKIYLIFSVVCTVGLIVLGMSTFDAVLHAMTTVSTGGFSPKNASVGHFDSIPIEIWISIFMILGSLSFMLYVFIVQRKWKRVASEEEGKFYLILLVIVCAAIALDLFLATDDHTFGQAFHESFFNVISISSTTGFAVSDYDQWPLFSRMLLIFLMVVGGCAGSTAGGVKMNRVILFKRIARMELTRTFRPHQVFKITLNGVAPDRKVLVTATLFLALALIIILISSLLIALLEPDLNLISVFGCSFATLFNTGPGFESVGPTDNFAFLNDGTLALLSLLMVIGRLEFFAILVLFMPSLWKKY